MKYLIKPLSKTMLAHLQKARDIELSVNGRNICTSDDFKGSLSGLSGRGFVNTKKVLLNGKEIMAVFITQSGINFLNNYNQEVIKSANNKSIV